MHETESPQWKLGQLFQWLGKPMGKLSHYFIVSVLLTLMWLIKHFLTVIAADTNFQKTVFMI
jgi:hypothetical protein